MIHRLHQHGGLSLSYFLWHVALISVALIDVILISVALINTDLLSVTLLDVVLLTVALLMSCLNCLKGPPHHGLLLAVLRVARARLTQRRHEASHRLQIY